MAEIAAVPTGEVAKELAVAGVGTGKAKAFGTET